ncbi:uncharacterized protein LOC128236215 [Mya arenaria]|uniref:uncharacterized protein LOC128236215 n=1 Tax=Mya arenaria TaxID=6604 RepID=UPI0022E8FEF0|nr:uncharacterized protein LOC128236215 [Mya arenaria]
MSAYDQFEKLFCGEWKFDKAENAEEFCNNAKMSPEDKQMLMNISPDILFQRKGDSFLQTYRLAPGVEISATIKFGEEYESRDTNEPPRWHNKVKPSFTNGVFVQEIYSQLPGKCDLVVDGKMEGDYLVTTTCVKGDPSVKGIKYYKKV